MSNQKCVQADSLIAAAKAQGVKMIVAGTKLRLTGDEAVILRLHPSFVKYREEIIAALVAGGQFVNVRTSENLTPTVGQPIVSQITTDDFTPTINTPTLYETRAYARYRHAFELHAWRERFAELIETRTKKA